MSRDRLQHLSPWFRERDGYDTPLNVRVFIHEIAHNTGLDHAYPGMAIVAGQEGSAGAAEVAHGADSYALFAYRIYTRTYRGEIERYDAI